MPGLYLGIPDFAQLFPFYGLFLGRQYAGMDYRKERFEKLHSFLQGYREAGDLVRNKGKPDLLAQALTESKDHDKLRGALAALYHLARGDQ